MFCQHFDKPGVVDTSTKCHLEVIMIDLNISEFTEIDLGALRVGNIGETVSRSNNFNFTRSILHGIL